MKLIWGDTVYYKTPMNKTGQGAEIGYATDDISTWRIYELDGYGRDYLLAVESDDVWRVMSTHPPESPFQQYILENATEKQKFERMLSVTLYSDGTAILATPPISSYALIGSYYYTFTDDELLIHYENDNIIARFTIIDDNTLVFKEATEPLFADVGARYVCTPLVSAIGESNASAPPPLDTLTPAIMLDSILYISTGRVIAIDIDESEVFGRVESSVSMSEWPVENGQTNMPHLVDSPYAAFDDGFIVQWEDHGWMLFRSRDTVIAEERVEMPDDFAFRIDFGIQGRNSINTYNNTFTKDLVTAGSETIDFIVPADMMQFMYEMFVTLNIPGCPDDINAFALSSMGDSRMQKHPADKYTLTYTCNGETRTIICNDEGPWDSSKGPPAFRDNLANFVKHISEYIYRSEEYQNMSPSVGAYS